MRYVILCLLLVGCKNQETTSPANVSLSCRGIYYERDSAGTLKKYNQYLLEGRCLTENVQLTQFEKTQEKWNKNQVSCVPQAGFNSRTVIAANNFYDYRDGRAYLDFDSNTGIFRRIILGENKTGLSVITRLQGCFYERAGQLLLDTDVNKLITTQNFDPMEIFTYVATATDLNMVRFDDTKDYTYVFCPTLNTPWKFCEKLRDGNEMYFPVLPLVDQTALTNEAIIISREFNWRVTSKASFDNLWNDMSQKESMREDYKYDVVHIPDVPRYIDQAWREYVMGTRPIMPDVNSSTLLNLCYQGSKTVTLSDGSTGKIYGEICFVNGVYTFTQ